ncbi:YfkD famly protein [Sutcliffiella halmapala]|uniref:YfkD famly protein n=1 Tax=Sutcliffiella halmapala TaxID=79882 RepID=UPI000994BAC6|nr:YfkD famly protein [Sutcliffiella halmapala]
MRILRILFILVLSFGLSTGVQAEQAKGKAKEKNIEVPNYVLDISKDNTYPNPTQDVPYLQPSELTQELIDSSNVNVENPNLIKILNESNISPSPVAIGYRATIYLGEWPLYYESAETNVNWEYQKINTNYADNRGGKAPHQIFYRQEAQRHVKGGLTSKVESSEEVKQMMMLKAMQKTKLPLSFQTIVGAGTKKDQIYNIPIKRLGYLYAYSPAVNEKGKITYGEVYLVLKGKEKKIVVKNVTSQGIGAWIPVQDHVSFIFAASERPR